MTVSRSTLAGYDDEVPSARLAFLAFGERVDDQAVDRGGELPVAAVEVPELVREHRGQELALQQPAREHQRVAAHGGVGLGRVEDEPQPREPQRQHGVCLQQPDRVAVGDLLALGGLAAAHVRPPPPAPAEAA